MVRFLLAAIFTLASVVPTTAGAAEHTSDTEATVKDNLSTGAAVLVDVREADEWEAGHLIVATNVPLSELRNGGGSDGLPRDKILYLHCQSGRRVLPAADLLIGFGFRDVRALPWGFPELVRRGFAQAP